MVALVGVTVFRAMFPARKGAVELGLQAERIGEAVVFVLPNPSGRNANFAYAEMLAAFRALKRYLSRIVTDEVRFLIVRLRSCLRRGRHGGRASSSEDPPIHSSV